MRIVSICPSNTELLAYLGLLDQLVGVDNYSDWPEEVNHLPRLGPDLSINMDKVEELQPDLVVASLSVPGMEKNIKALQERGLPYIVLNPNSLEEIGKDLLTLGQHTQTEKRAEAVVSRYQTLIHQYKTIAKTLTNWPSLYWEWWPKPVFTPGGQNWLTEISRLAGTENVYGKEDIASVKTSWGDICQQDPDHICMIWVGVKPEKIKPEFVLKREKANSLSAVKNNRIHVLEEPYFCRPSPRLLIGLQRIAALIHPEHFPAFDGVDPLID